MSEDKILKRIAYFDCFSGVSGDMLLGALVDAGAEASELFNRVQRVTGKGVFSWTVKRECRGSIWGTRVYIESGSEGFHSYRHIREHIESSDLGDVHKGKILEVFARLAAAEAKIHNISIENVHFHEIGSVDTVVDIVGVVIGLSMLGLNCVYSSPLPMGRGFIKCAHGVLPNPAPATLEILRGIPVCGVSKDRELVTPTGASLLAIVCQAFGHLPPVTIETIGYGVGNDRDEHPPNVLRLILGIPNGAYIDENLLIGETNIDDMSPEVFSHLYGMLFSAGAHDVWVVPCYMKKNRPGWLLSILCSSTISEKIQSVVFRETTSSGMRWNEVKRVSLKREFSSVNTPYGPVKVKIFEVYPGIQKAYPEYDDCVTVSKRTGVSVREVYECAMSRINIGDITTEVEKRVI